MRGWQIFSVKVQIVRLSGFASDMVSDITSELWCCTVKAVVDNIGMAMFQKNLFLQKQQLVKFGL